MGKREQDKGAEGGCFYSFSRWYSVLLLLVPISLYLSSLFSFLRCEPYSLRCPRSLPRYEEQRWTDDSKRVTRLSMQPDTCVYACARVRSSRRLESVERERGKGVCAKVHRKLGSELGGRGSGR